MEKNSKNATDVLLFCCLSGKLGVEEITWN